LVSILYLRLKIAEKEHWLGTAIRRTLPLVLAIAILVAVEGACLENLAPGGCARPLRRILSTAVISIDLCVSPRRANGTRSLTASFSLNRKIFESPTH
jgi:hypothetical protein